MGRLAGEPELRPEGPVRHRNGWRRLSAMTRRLKHRDPTGGEHAQELTRV